MGLQSSPLRPKMTCQFQLPLCFGERAVCIMNHGFSPSKSHKRLLNSDKPGIREIKEDTKEETTPNHRIHTTPLHKLAHSAIAISNDSTHIFTVTQQRIAYAMLLRASQRELPQPPHKAEVSEVSVTQSPTPLHSKPRNGHDCDL